MKRVIIVGAGVSGLSLGYFLKRAGNQVTILEASSHVGGAIRSERHGGFLLEYGPNSVLTKPSTEQLIADLKLTPAIVTPSTSARDRFIATRCALTSQIKLVPVPHGLTDALTSQILSGRGKMRLLREPWSKQIITDDIDVWSFFSQRCGAAFATEVIATMLSGVWAADTKKLSLRSALPAIWDIAQSNRSLLSLALPHKSAQPKPRILSFGNGMSELVTSLQRQFASNELFANTAVAQITDSSDAVVVTTDSAEIEADEVVLTTPADVTAAVLEKHDARLVSALRAIPYAPLGILHLKVEPSFCPAKLAGFGFLSSPSANLATRGVIFSSSLFSGRAPGDTHLLTAFIGGAPAADRADIRIESLRIAAIEEISSVLQLTQHPEIIASQFWPRAIPNYAVGHYKTVAAVEQFSKQHPRIRVIGNWLRGISVADRIEEAKKSAELICESSVQSLR